jgi:hypothetical protein
MAEDKVRKTERDTQRAQDVEQDEVDQDPGQRQRENQNNEKDDPLAA